MRPSASLVVLLPLLVTAITPSAAFAEYTLRATHIGDGDPIPSNGKAIANAADCTGSAVVRISLTGTNASGGTVTAVDIWRGAPGATCEMGATRVNTTSPMCVHVGNFPVTGNFVNGETGVTITALMTGSTVCTAGTPGASAGTEFKFVAIATSTPGDTSIDATTMNNFLLTVDAVAPTAPTVDEDDAYRLGRSVTIEFDTADDSSMVTNKIYVDRAGTCDGMGTPTSAVLKAGEAPPAGLEGQESTSVTGTPPSQAVVGVTTVDLAGNASKLSALICVEFVETSGFCESDPDCQKNCAVSAPGRAGGTNAFLVIAMLASTALLVHARGRRSTK